jgi:heat shock protein HslJ
MKTMITRTSVVSLGMLTLLASCRPENSQEDRQQIEPVPVEVSPQEIPVTDLAPLVGREWKLIDLCGVEVPEDSKASLTFLADERITGSGSVNRFNGPMRLVDGRIDTGPIATTRMAGPPEDMEREHLYLNALGSAKNISTLGDDQLIIAVEDKELPLRFRSATTP